jgi:hypothetical protein
MGNTKKESSTFGEEKMSEDTFPRHLLDRFRRIGLEELMEEERMEFKRELECGEV